MLVIDNGPVPPLVRVTVFAVLVVPMFWAAKLRLVGERLAVGAVPVPLRLTACGLPAALSAMLNAPVRKPVAVGVKVTWMVQPTPTAKIPGQLLDCAKLPRVAMPLIESGVPPQLTRATDCGALVVPTFCPAKVKLAGAMQAAGGGGTTLRVTVVVCTSFPSVPVMVSVAGPVGVELVLVMFSVDVPTGIGLGVKVPATPAGKPTVFSV